MVRESLRVRRRFSKQRGRNRTPRPKTFTTEESANKWAKSRGFEKYALENIRLDDRSKKKIRVIVEV